MHHNQILIQQLGLALRKHLQGYVFFDGFSLNRNELVLVFNKIDEWLSVKLIIEARTFFVQFYNYPMERKSSSYLLFEELKNIEFQTVFLHKNERSFQMVFSNNYSLIFKLYGSLANVLFFEGNNLKELFRPQIESDKHLILNNFTIQEEENDCYNISTNFYIYNNEKDFPVLNIDPENNLTNTQFPSIFEAYNEFTKQYLGKYFFTQKKEKLIQQFENELKRWKPIYLNASKALQFLQINARNEELGHIIMANLHLMKKGDETLITSDFYNNSNTISIKLKSNFNPQENAQYYYKKSRNQKKEEQLLTDKIKQANEKILFNEAKLAVVLIAQNMKDLKQFELPELKSKSKKEQRETYREFIHKGWKVLVGKSAANNDELTLKVAHKNDLWLHAKGVSGSHVVIKHQNNKAFTNEIITFAAQVAAYYSKSKGSAMVPVIYTPKKFVRKPKGAEPGQVFVEKEEVTLVTPNLNY